MNSFSVIVTACNNAGVLPRALRSVEDAIAILSGSASLFRENAAEIVVVDDGSTDNTENVLAEITRGKEIYRIVRHSRPSSPSFARNAGVKVSKGELLFFLDGDDFYFARHLQQCLTALSDPHFQFAKTGVRLADRIHPDWKERVEHSLVINLCVRRRCHLAIGGFLDYHLFVRDGDGFRHQTDIFWKFEDQYYSELLARLFPGVRIVEETVEHVRYPGNSFDRQYEKFCQPCGSYREMHSLEERFRLSVAELIFEHRLHQLQTVGKRQEYTKG